MDTALPHAPDAAFAPAATSLRSEVYLARIAVRVRDRIVIVAVDDLRRIDAEGSYVRLWTDRPLLHKQSLTALCARLDPARFLRVHRSHAVNLLAVRELHPRPHGEFRIRLDDGHELLSGRAYRDAIRAAFALD